MPHSEHRLPALSRVFMRLGRRLYARLWLAVLLTVAVLILLVSWVWQLTAEPPLREAVVRNEQGQIVGHGLSHHRRHHPADAEPTLPNKAGLPPPGASGPGPEFLVRMDDGQVLHVHLPRPARTPWSRPPLDFFWMLTLVGVAVALATYPIVRKLTRRLEQLHHGVEQWGRGDLAVRVAVQGQDEVAFLARRFNLAAARIQDLLTAHKTLLANASHELRSPITRIRMGLALMGEQASASFRQEIERNIAELEQLIDEILLASRLDSLATELGPMESVELLGLAAEECARVGATLQATPGQTEMRVLGVPKLLRRAMRNLLENARRFSPDDLSLSIQSQGQQQLVRVSDRGPGVPAELRERIFEPFYRLPGASEREGNVGLGLALVKSIVERHGGQVHCEDNPGGGACFVIALPVEVDRPLTNPASSHK